MTYQPITQQQPHQLTTPAPLSSPARRPADQHQHQPEQPQPKCASCENASVPQPGDWCAQCHAEREEFAAEQRFEAWSAIHPKAR
jgi:hypothetical protein